MCSFANDQAGVGTWGRETFLITTLPCEVVSSPSLEVCELDWAAASWAKPWIPEVQRQGWIKMASVIALRVPRDPVLL